MPPFLVVTVDGDRSELRQNLKVGENVIVDEEIDENGEKDESEWGKPTPR